MALQVLYMVLLTRSSSSVLLLQDQGIPNKSQQISVSHYPSYCLRGVYCKQEVLRWIKFVVKEVGSDVSKEELKDYVLKTLKSGKVYFLMQTNMLITINRSLIVQLDARWCQGLDMQF